MLETYFSTAKMLRHLRSGPSGPYLDGFAGALERQGYVPDTAVRYLRAAAHVGHVMAEQGASLTDIDLVAFGEHLCTCRCPRPKGGRRNHHTIYGARLFRRHLVEFGVCQSATVVVAPAEPKLVADFWCAALGYRLDEIDEEGAVAAEAHDDTCGAEVPQVACRADHCLCRAQGRGQGLAVRLCRAARAGDSVCG